ncbi:MAG: UbiX family flavin prenyltransferase [Firmicutes bacterium]|nr:UbiX family flavin prenyltransferase [Bacillota bacterium]
MELVVGISGASGAIYGYGLVRVLDRMGVGVHVVCTPVGQRVLQHECGVGLDTIRRYATVHSNDDLFSPLASGSHHTDGMAVVPCSMHTLGVIASGLGEGLLARAADVTLKERRRLVVVPRETPVTIIHMENMLKLGQAGAVIVPASPGFYNHPQTMSDLVGAMIGRILDILGVDNQLFTRWGQQGY